MRYAVCSNDPAVIADSREAGFDYVEASVPNLVRPSDPEEAFAETLETYRAAGLPIESVNLFLPRELRCTGPDAVPMDRLAEYAETVCRRLGRAGVPILVFGSGGARKLPDGWPREKADGQFVALLSRIGPIAERHGVKATAELPMDPAVAKLVDGGAVEHADVSALDGLLDEVLKDVSNK